MTITPFIVDPTAAANSALSAEATSASTAINAALGGAAATLVAALTGSSGLVPSLATLAIATGMLSGAVSPTGGAFGLQDAIDHLQNSTSFFGSSPPTSVSPATVLAPLQFGPAMTEIESQLVSLTAAVIAGVTSVASATATVDGWITQVNALMPAANTAIMTLQTALPVLNIHLSVGSMHLSSDPNLQSLGVLLGNASPTMASLQGEQTNIITLSAEELAVAASFPDSTAVQPGATGGA